MRWPHFTLERYLQPKTAGGDSALWTFRIEKLISHQFARVAIDWLRCTGAARVDDRSGVKCLWSNITVKIRKQAHSHESMIIHLTVPCRRTTLWWVWTVRAGPFRVGRIRFWCPKLCLVETDAMIVKFECYSDGWNMASYLLLNDCYHLLANFTFSSVCRW